MHGETGYCDGSFWKKPQQGLPEVGSSVQGLPPPGEERPPGLKCDIFTYYISLVIGYLHNCSAFFAFLCLI